MLRFRPAVQWGLLHAVACLSFALSGCSNATSGGNAGNGGAEASGGMTGSGGQRGTGGTSGGTVASGGSQGSGGTTATATGGQTGSGGVTASGGRTGTGGSTATGGNDATGGNTGMGGTSAAGGTSGDSSTGGATSNGGRTGTGGRTGSGGVSSAGGSMGGQPGTGGTTPGGAGGGTGSVGSGSDGCGKTPTLKNSPSATANQNTIGSRQFLIRWPSNYDNTHPYRLVLGFHGAGGKDTDIAPSYFGLFDLSNNTTIFVAPSANGGTWDATADLTFVDQILEAVEADLCIDTSRIEIEGFSQGGAMVAVLACSRPGVFRAAVGHSRGGLTAPSTCQPIPYLGSLGLSDIGSNSQVTQTDPFAKWNGCTVTTLPTAPTGGHVCTDYSGCPAADPVVWCSFDGPHTASPTDAGQNTSWMPSVVWPFLSQF